MIKNIQILILLLLTGTLFAKYHIVIVAGQSNCLNIHTRAADLSACESDSLVPFFYDLYYPPHFAPNDLVTSSDDQWETLHTHMRETNTGPTYGFFGPEIILARTLLQHMDSVAIFKYGVAGSDLAYDWGLDVTGGPEIFDKFVAKIRMAEQAMTSAGLDFEWYAATWMQGESDADNLTQASFYYRNLGYFMKCLRDTLHVPDLPIAIGQIADELRLDQYPYREKVLEAQRRRTEADPRAILVNTADYDMDIDNVHFNTQGVISLGEGFADAILSLTTETAISGRLSDDRFIIRSSPNPVNGNLKINLDLDPLSPVHVSVYDVLGHRIRHLEGSYAAGTRELTLPVHDLNSGTYIAVVRTNGQTAVDKFSVVK